MRKALKQFAEFQEKILKDNDCKLGWKECSLNDLYEKLQYEMIELSSVILSVYSDVPPDESIDEEIKEQISKECADVANFAMMIYDIVNRKI